MPQTATEFFQGKTLLPSEMRTEQWSRLPLQVREAAFFSAGVDRAEYLTIQRDFTEKVLRGELSESEARVREREALEAAGYVAAPGQAGTIKDLTSTRRLNVKTRTSVALAQGWAREQELVLAGAAFPAKKLVRMSPRKEPRDWPDIFRKAAAAYPGEGEIAIEILAAQVGHPIWVAMSDFGAPHDPIKWQTGMRQLPMSRREAEKYGIRRRAAGGNGGAARDGGAPGLPELAGAAEPVSSPFATLSRKPEISPDLREALVTGLGGLAEWGRREGGRTVADARGDVLIFTDPNGTRPYAAADLARVLRVDVVEDNYQRRALEDALPELTSGQLADWVARNRGTDRLDDFARLARRIVPEGGQTVREALLILAQLLGFFS